MFNAWGARGNTMQYATSPYSRWTSRLWSDSWRSTTQLVIILVIFLSTINLASRAVQKFQFADSHNYKIDSTTNQLCSTNVMRENITHGNEEYNPSVCIYIVPSSSPALQYVFPWSVQEICVVIWWFNCIWRISCTCVLSIILLIGHIEWSTLFITRAYVIHTQHWVQVLLLPVHFILHWTVTNESCWKTHHIWLDFHATTVINEVLWSRNTCSLYTTRVWLYGGSAAFRWCY